MSSCPTPIYFAGLPEVAKQSQTVHKDDSVQDQWFCEYSRYLATDDNPSRSCLLIHTSFLVAPE